MFRSFALGVLPGLGVTGPFGWPAAVSGGGGGLRAYLPEEVPRSFSSKFLLCQGVVLVRLEGGAGTAEAAEAAFEGGLAKAVGFSPKLAPAREVAAPAAFTPALVRGTSARSQQAAAPDRADRLDAVRACFRGAAERFRAEHGRPAALVVDGAEHLSACPALTRALVRTAKVAGPPVPVPVVCSRSSMVPSAQCQVPPTGSRRRRGRRAPLLPARAVVGGRRHLPRRVRHQHELSHRLHGRRAAPASPQPGVMFPRAA